MKYLRVGWWIITGFLRKHGKLLSLGIVVGILLTITLPPLLVSFQKRTTVVTIGIVGRYRTRELPEDITSTISEGITTTDEDGSAKPGLASSWAVSDDGLVYTFILDQTRRWHDGTLVKSTDIQVPVENVTVETVDEQTIRFVLREPFAPLPTILSRPVFKQGLIGVGSHRVRRVKKNGEFVEQLSLVAPDGTSVEYRFYRTSQDLVTALKLGEIDVASGLTSVAGVPDWNEFVVEPVLRLNRYLAVFFNTKDPFLEETSHRQALTYAIPGKPDDRSRVLSPIHPSSWAYNPQVKPYTTDLEQARELLASAGDLPNLELLTYVPYLPTAEAIASAWTELGVKTTVRVATSLPTEFQTLLVGQEIPVDPDQYTLWHSTQATNISRYSDFRIDKLLEEGRRTLDQGKRKEIYRDFQRFLLEDAPAAFISHITTYTVRRK